MPSKREILWAVGAAASTAIVSTGILPKIGKPFVARAASRAGDRAGGELIPQDFAGGAPTDWTAALHDMATAAVRDRRPMHLPDIGRPYVTGPWALPDAPGLHVSGPSTRTSPLAPINAAQPHLLYVPSGATGCRLDDLCFADLERPPSDRVRTALLSDCAQELRLRAVRIDGAATGLWAREGGYSHFEQIYVARTTERAYAFGGGSNRRQLSESWFSELIADAGLGDGDQDKSVGTAFDIDSGSAFLHFLSPTAAGQAVGMHIRDGRGDGQASRPDGINLWDANFDWTAGEALRIDSAGRVLVHGGNFRSLKNWGARLAGFGTVEWDSSNVYASHSGGIRVEGGFNDLYLRAGSRVIGNGWPDNRDGIGIELAGGSGRVTIEGGTIGNSARAATVGAGYLALGTTNRQTYGLVVDEGFTGDLRLLSVDFDGNDGADMVGLVRDGRLRPRTRIRDVDAFRTDAQGTITDARPTAPDGLIAIAHGLPVTPSWWRIDSTNPRVEVVGLRATAVSLECRLRDARGIPLVQGQFDLRWEARV